MVDAIDKNIAINTAQANNLTSLNIVDFMAQGENGPGAHLRLDTWHSTSASIVFGQYDNETPRASLTYHGDTNIDGPVESLVLVNSESNRDVVIKGRVMAGTSAQFWQYGAYFDFEGKNPSASKFGNQVRILSASDAYHPSTGVSSEPEKSPDPRTWPDTNFFVSGTVGSADRRPSGHSWTEQVRGTSVFGGDMVVSGSAYLGGLTVSSPTILEITSSMVDIGWDPDDPTTDKNGPALRLSSHYDSIDADDILGKIEFWGGDTDVKGIGAEIRGVAHTRWNLPGSDRPTEIQFYATDGSGDSGNIFTLSYAGAGVGTGRAVLNVDSGKAQANLHINDEGSTGGGSVVLSREDSSISTNETLGTLSFMGTENAGTDWATGATISAHAEEGTWKTPDAAGSYLKFATQVEGGGGVTAPTEKLRVTAGGRVGVGTGNPQARIHVYDTSSDGATILVSSKTTASGSIAFTEEGGATQAALVYEAVTDRLVLAHSGSAEDIIIKLNAGSVNEWMGAFFDAGDTAVGIDTEPSTGTKLHLSDSRGISAETRLVIESGPGKTAQQIFQARPASGEFSDGFAKLIYNTVSGSNAGHYRQLANNLDADGGPAFQWTRHL